MQSELIAAALADSLGRKDHPCNRIDLDCDAVLTTIGKSTGKSYTCPADALLDIIHAAGYRVPGLYVSTARNCVFVEYKREPAKHGPERPEVAQINLFLGENGWNW